MAAAQSMCQMTLTTALLGVANFCYQFKKCCNNGRSIPCTITIPCKDVSVSAHAWNSAYYFASTKYKVKGRSHRSDYSINIREVAVYNKHHIPPFRDVGFEFRDISKSFKSYSSDFNLHNLMSYFKMINRLSSLAKKQFADTKGVKGFRLRKEEEEVLLTICEDFAESNNKKIESKIENAVFMKVDGDGTKIHFDEAPEIDLPTKYGTRIKVWIPLSDIDNFPLAVGDVRSYYKLDGPCKGDNSIGRCATKRDFKDAIWYQQEQMTPIDAVFWNKHAVPHCSLNLGIDGIDMDTQDRIALILEFVAEDGAN